MLLFSLRIIYYLFIYLLDECIAGRSNVVTYPNPLNLDCRYLLDF